MNIVSFHILMAEDNESQQIAVGRLLRKRGHTVVISGNRKEAVALLEKQRLDFVLMDIRMPEMDGIQATRAIRSPDSKVLERNIPIIALTSLDEENFREHCLEAGMDAYIPKPLTIAALHEALIQAMRRRGETKCRY